jgi:polysaccharide pyruvyl transferase WcaK-like protein
MREASPARKPAVSIESRYQPRPGARILLCGVPYSANLGDGIIADCATALIKQYCPNCEVRYLDLAGRAGFGDGKKAKLLFRLLAIVPTRLRPLAVSAAMAYWIGPRLSRQWRENIQWCDLAIIGGGQLLMDVDLNFPLKIHRLAMLLEHAGKPVSYYACGVAKDWSSSAARLFRRALSAQNVRFISVRDPYSVLALNHHLAGVPHVKPVLTPDPALYACSVYGKRPPRSGSRPILALGIISPDVVNRFLSSHARQSRSLFKTIFVEAAMGLAADFDVRLFSNGSYEDRVFLDEVWAELEHKQLPITRDSTPTRPAELAALIKGADVLVSHRLHANIVAYSYGVPSVGLGWDAKVKEFFSLCRRDAFFLDGNCLNYPTIVQKARAAHAAGIASERHRQLLDMAVAGSTALLGSLRLSDNGADTALKPDLSIAQIDLSGSC